MIAEVPPIPGSPRLPSTAMRTPQPPAPPEPPPRRLERWKRRKKGPFLGAYRDPETGQIHYLRADNQQPQAMMVLGPPGTGKSSCFYIPSLLDWEESAFVFDPKGELFMLTAGYRRAELANKILRFAPTQPEFSCHINPLDRIRFGTRYEISDLQNVVKLILDPADKAAEGAEAHWIVTGSILLECVILFLHYTRPRDCNLAGCYDLLTDQAWGEKGVDTCLNTMATFPHDPLGKMGWTNPITREATPFHPYIVGSAMEVLRKAPNEKSGVVSTTTRFLQPYREGMLRELTAYSDFDFDALMNHETPVTLYFCIPVSDLQRMRVVVRLVMNLLVRAHTGDDALEYKRNRAKYRFKHRLALFLDEYPQLGRQEQFVLSLAAIRSFGIWPILGVQVPSQLKDVGNAAAITGMCRWKIILTPNDHESAKWAADEVGKFTGENVQRSMSGSRLGWKTNESISVAPVDIYMITEGELMDMRPHHAVGRFAGMPPVRLETVFFEDVPELKRRAYDYPPPEISDVIPIDPVQAANDIVKGAAASQAMQDALKARISDLEAKAASAEPAPAATSTPAPAATSTPAPAGGPPTTGPAPTSAAEAVASTASAAVATIAEHVAVEASAPSASATATDEEDLDFFKLADDKKPAPASALVVPADVDDLLRERDEETEGLYNDELPSDEPPEAIEILDEDATMFDPVYDHENSGAAGDDLTDDYDH